VSPEPIESRLLFRAVRCAACPLPWKRTGEGVEERRAPRNWATSFRLRPEVWIKSRKLDTSLCLSWPLRNLSRARRGPEKLAPLPYKPLSRIRERAEHFVAPGEGHLAAGILRARLFESRVAQSDALKADPHLALRAVLSPTGRGLLKGERVRSFVCHGIGRHPFDFAQGRLRARKSVRDADW